MNRLLDAIGRGRFSAVLSPQRDRKLIHLHGPDTYTMLNRLTTKKIEDPRKLIKPTDKVQNDDQQDLGFQSVYAAFLNDKGRILTDSIIYHRPLLHSVWMDIHQSSVDLLIEHLKKYKLRNKIWIDDEQDTNKTYKLYSLLATNEDHLKKIILWLYNTTTAYDVHFYQDPRWPLALRLILPFDKNPLDCLPANGTILDDETQSIYTYLRHLNGITQVPEIISNKSIPLECNLEYWHAIDFDKGCYLGQELIARTFYSGTIRKRLFPILSLNKNDLSETIPGTWASSIIEASPHQLIPQEMINKQNKTNQGTRDKSERLTCQIMDSSENIHPLSIINDSLVKTKVMALTSRDQVASVSNLLPESRDPLNQEGRVDIAMLRLSLLKASELTGYCFWDPTHEQLYKTILPLWYRRYMLKEDESGNGSGNGML